MSINTLTTRVTFSADGAATAFPFTFPISVSSDLRVFVRVTATGVTTELVEGAGAGKYTVAATAGDYGSGGTVTTGDTYASGNEIVILRATPKTQETDYVNGNAFPANSHEAALDRLTKIAQDNQEQLTRSLHVPISEVDGTTDLTLPDKVDRANKFLGFDADGNPATGTATVFAHAATHTNGTDDIQDATASVKGLATAAQITKLDGIEAGADITDTANVDAAGAVMNADTTTAAMSFVLDEDNMASDSATKLATQQSIKAYVDSEVGGAVAGLYDHKGAYDASANSPDLDTSPSGILKADAYTVSVAGTFFTEAVEIGDVLIADQDNPTLLSHWTRINKNIDAATTTTKGIVELATDGESAANVVVQGNDARLSDARTPTSHNLAGAEHAADTLANLNAKVSDATLIDTADSRLSDARTPTAHAATHTNGTDDIQNATASVKGLATAAQITKLDGITAGANVTKPGTTANDQVAVWTGNGTIEGTSALVFDGTGLGIGIAPVVGSKLTLPQENDFATPTLAFGDGDTGFFESADDSIAFATAGLTRATLNSTGLSMNNSFGGILRYVNASATEPSVGINKIDLDTGIGSAAADQLSLIAGGVEASRFTENGGVIQANQLTAGIIASVTQSQGNGALTSSYNEVATVANPNDTVTLPSAEAGMICEVVNNGANTLRIYPASGDDLGAGLNTFTSLGAGSYVRYRAYTATNWKQTSGGSVSKVGTPVDNQVGVWTGDGTIEGDAGLTYDGTTLKVDKNATNSTVVLVESLGGTKSGIQVRNRSVTSRFVTMDFDGTNTRVEGQGLPFKVGANGQDLILYARTGAANTIQMQTSDTTRLEITDTGTVVTGSQVAATGNEAALTLSYTTNKATSGDDTGLLINKTDTLSPGVSLLADLQTGGVSQFKVDDAGRVTAASNLGVVAAPGSAGATIQSTGSNILELNNSGGPVQVTFDNNGRMKMVGAGSPTNIQIGLRNASNLGIYSPAANELGFVAGGTNRLHIRNDNATLVLPDTTDNVQLIVKGAPTQTNQILQVTNNADSVVFGVANDGSITTSGTVDGIDIATDVAANTAKVTNATHTGDVTGSGALTIDKTAITGKTTVTGVSGDFVLISDTSDTGNLKKVDLADLLGGGLANVVEDLTPQLGGTLDGNAQSINNVATLGTENTSTSSNGITVDKYSATSTTAAPTISLRKSHNDTLDTLTTTLDTEGLGTIEFEGTRSSPAFWAAAIIKATQDGTASASRVPGKLEFQTSTDTAGPSTRLTIKPDGAIHIPADNQKLLFGAAQDASLYYDGTNLQINAQEVGSGYSRFTGNVGIGSNPEDAEQVLNATTTMTAVSAGAAIFPRGVKLNVTSNPSGVGTAHTTSHIGFDASITSAGSTDPTDEYYLTGLFGNLQHSSTNTPSRLTGLFGLTETNAGSGTTTEAIGLRGQVTYNGGIITTGTGVRGEILGKAVSTSGTDVNLVAGRADVQSGDTLTLTSLKALAYEHNPSGGTLTVTNFYGLYMPDVSAVGGTVSDAIHTLGGDWVQGKDNSKILLGTGEDASILYDGTDLVVNPKEVGSGQLKVSGNIGATQDIVLTEQADHSSTPAAGFGYLWVRNDAPSSLIFTDDTGTDTEISAGNGLGSHGELIVTTALTNTANGTPAKLAGAGVTAAGDLNAFTHTTPNRLTYTGTATKKFFVHFSASVTHSSNNTNVTLSVAKNGTNDTTTNIQRKIGTGGDVGAICGGYIIELATNDYLELFSDADSAGTTTMSLAHFTIMEGDSSTSGGAVLSENTTVNFTSGQTLSAMQALIDAQPKNLGGYTLTFQFGNGTYNDASLTAALSFADFYGGELIIQGNTGDTVPYNPDTTNPSVILDFSAGTSSGIEVTRSCFTLVQNLEVRTGDGTTTGGIVIQYSFNRVQVNNCVCDATGKTNTPAGVLIRGGYGYVTNSFFSNTEYGLHITDGASIASQTNNDYGTQPNYGIYAPSGIVMKAAAQVNGSIADENAINGGVIR